MDGSTEWMDRFFSRRLLSADFKLRLAQVWTAWVSPLRESRRSHGRRRRLCGESLELRLALSSSASCLGNHCRTHSAFVPDGPFQQQEPVSPDDSPDSHAAHSLSFQPVTPEGMLVAHSIRDDQLELAGEVDRFQFELDGGQSISILVQPDSTLQPQVLLRAPDQSVASRTAATAPGQHALLQAVPAVEAGIYQIDVTSLGSSVGPYRMTVYLNGVFEREAIGGPSNSDLSTAQSLDGMFLGWETEGADRVAVIGGRRDDLQEDFETGTLNAEWSTASTRAGGRIRVTNEVAAASGDYALIMDREDIGLPVGNEAIWTVDLEGFSEATLSFYHADFNDEENPLPDVFTGRVVGDGVSISDDGVTWHTVLNAPRLAPFQWTWFSIDLGAAARAAGISLDRDFLIKFQQYDDFPLTNDGRGYDQIQITVTPPLVFEDWYEFEVADGQVVTIAYAGVEDDHEPLLELYDADGVLLARADQAANVDRMIQRYRNRDEDGAPDSLFVRIARPATEYSLLITRDADYERERTIPSIYHRIWALRRPSSVL